MDVVKPFEFAADLAKQLITLATGIIALTITFAKDFVGSSHVADGGIALWAWVTFLMSIVCGLWTLMALTGTLQRAADTQAAPSVNGPNIRIPLAIQIITFVLALGLTLSFGWKNVLPVQ